MDNSSPRSDREIRQLLRKRVKRAKASCYPCRTRKVKCDKSSPCENCSKRGYPELCSFDAPGTSKDLSLQVGTTESSGSRSARPLGDQHHTRLRNGGGIDYSADTVFDTPNGSRSMHRHLAEDGDSNSLARLKDMSNLRSPGREVDEFQGEQPQRDRFFGANSMPAFLRDHSPQADSIQESPAHTVEDAILPILGLKAPKSSYPFLPHPENSIDVTRSTLFQSIPPDHETIRLFQHYKSSAHSFTPIVPDIDDFEVELCLYLEERATLKRQTSLLDSSTPIPKDLTSVSWIASLFAILASGAQYSQYTTIERQSMSRLYARYSFQGLRLANFLVQPSLLCIQTLLILGNVLQNDMKPEAAWILLGTTVRMAQSLGLHKDKKEDTTSRAKLWKALVWQDSLLSLCFDRPPTTSPSVNITQLAYGGSYQESMNALCDIVLRSVQHESSGGLQNFGVILEDVSKIEEIHRAGTSSTRSCLRLSISQRSEKFALNLHIYFVIAWLCRPALRNRRSGAAKSEIQQTLIEKCQMSLVECIRAFVRLYSLNSLASRSWPILHNGISSALLLGLLGEADTDPEVQQLQGELLGILSAESEDEDGRDQGIGDKIKLSAPHVRALAVLRKLSRKRSADPAPQEVIGNIGRHIEGDQPDLNSGVMFSNNSFDPNLPSVMDISEWNNSAGTYLAGASPLDMYDSIIWGNFPVDSNEDILARNPYTVDMGELPPDYGASADPWIF